MSEMYKCPKCGAVNNFKFCSCGGGNGTVDGLPLFNVPVTNNFGKYIIDNGEEPYATIKSGSAIALEQDRNKGVKHDETKPDLSLLPREFLDYTAQAFMYGEKKYGRYNYRGGMQWHRLIAAALRHLTAFNEHEDEDSESGLSHLGHASACIAMLIVYKEKGLGKDTRYERPL